MENFRILFVDDDRDILNLVENYLSRYQYNIQVVDNAKEALEMIRVSNFDLVFTDYKMPEIDGLTLLSTVKEYKPETVVVIVTGHGTMDSAIEAMRSGSYDYIQKPFKLEVLKLLIDKVYEAQKLDNETVFLRRRVTPRHRYGTLVGMNLKMQEIYETIDRMKDSSAHVLIQGETGTGKELAARLIHDIGDRGNLPFVPAKCAGFNGNRAASENLKRLSNLFKAANGGTLLLDEITEMPLDLQQVLAKALESGRLPKDGDGGAVTAGAVIIATSGTDLHEAPTRPAVDNLLLERLGTMSIKMPPLRDRKEDICPLIITFLDRIDLNAKNRIGGISARVMDALLAYNWPGNVIQLENVVERAVAMGVETTIRFEDLPTEIKSFGEFAKQ